MPARRSTNTSLTPRRPVALVAFVAPVAAAPPPAAPPAASAAPPAAGAPSRRFWVSSAARVGSTWRSCKVVIQDELGSLRTALRLLSFTYTGGGSGASRPIATPQQPLTRLVGMVTIGTVDMDESLGEGCQNLFTMAKLAVMPFLMKHDLFSRRIPWRTPLLNGDRLFEALELLKRLDMARLAHKQLSDADMKSRWGIERDDAFSLVQLITGSRHKLAKISLFQFMKLVHWLGFPTLGVDSCGALHAASAIRKYVSLVFEDSQPRDQRIRECLLNANFPAAVTELVLSYLPDQCRFGSAYTGMINCMEAESVLRREQATKLECPAILRLGQGNFLLGTLSADHLRMTCRRSFRHLVASVYDRSTDKIEHQYLFAYEPETCQTLFQDVGLNDCPVIAGTGSKIDANENGVGDVSAFGPVVPMDASVMDSLF